MIKMLEKQTVDGELKAVNEIFTTDTLTESVLVSHGKAEYVEEKQQDIPNLVGKFKKEVVE